MLILKHLKTLQHVLFIIHIIFRELVCSLLKTLNFKIFLRIENVNVVMRQHNVWCVCVRTWKHADSPPPKKISSNCVCT